LFVGFKAALSSWILPFIVLLYGLLYVKDHKRPKGCFAPAEFGVLI
jgi:hypothetical protein